MSIVLPRLTWVPSPNFSDRNAKVDLLVVHDCESSYGGAINWLTQKLSQVSAHYVLCENGTEAAQLVALDKKAWHCKAFNSRSIGLELAGWAKRGFSDDEWTAAANICAYLLHKFSIPAQWAQHGVGPGLTRHYDLGKAGGGHMDPTTDDRRWLAFVAQVQGIVAKGGFPDSWDADHTGNAKTFAIPHTSAQTSVHPVGR